MNEYEICETIRISDKNEDVGIKEITMRSLTRINDEDYFADETRIGSSVYSSYKLSKGQLATEQVKKKYIQEPKSSAFVFGSMLHDAMSGTLDIYSLEIDDKKNGTNEAMISNNIIGSKDFFVLKMMVDNFPLDLAKIKESSELFEQEKGYFFDIVFQYQGEEHFIKARCKPDLMFQHDFSDTVTIIDYKTASNFANKSMSVKYSYQSMLYATLMYLILEKREDIGERQSKFKFINYIFSKDHPYTQYDIPHELFDINEKIVNDIMIELIEVKKILENPEDYLHYNVLVGNDELLMFVKGE